MKHFMGGDINNSIKSIFISIFKFKFTLERILGNPISSMSKK